MMALVSRHATRPKAMKAFKEGCTQSTSTPITNDSGQRICIPEAHRVCAQREASELWNATMEAQNDAERVVQTCHPLLMIGEQDTNVNNRALILVKVLTSAKHWVLPTWAPWKHPAAASAERSKMESPIATPTLAVG